ncbi:vacuolar protein sorting-associated protein 53, partial [Lecanoromycetidae sp. Uapishka_2]
MADDFDSVSWQNEGDSDNERKTPAVTSEPGDPSDFASFSSPTVKVRRRFTDFVFLYKYLCREYPQCAVPPLPDKHKMEYVRGDRFGPDFTNRRAHSLHRFLKRLALHPTLRRAALLTIFLESTDWNATMRSHPKRSVSVSESSTSVFDNFADTFVNAFSKVHKPDKRFIEVREKADKLDEDLGHVSRIVARVSRREADLETDYADLSTQFMKLASLEPGIEGPTHAFAQSVEQTAKGLTGLKEHTDQNYLGSLRDMEAYTTSLKGLLKSREQKQLDYEGLTEYLNKASYDRDTLASSPYASQGPTGFIRSKIEDVRGVDHEQSRRERVRKLEMQIEKLIKEVEDARLTTEAFDGEVVREVGDFERIKAGEFKDCLGALADKHVEFYTGVIDTWERYLKDMEANYDPIEHLNAIFSHPSSLSSVPRTSRALHAYQNDLDQSIAAHVQQQSRSDIDSVKRIQAAKADLAELFQKVEGVRQRAIETEEAITEMTADIKRLDNTKKNLTLSMTALKRLQMLTTAYEQLQELSASRQYRECAQLLQAVIQLMAHFKSYRSIDQIATLSRNVSDLQREMLEQVCEDFEITFAKAEVGQRRGMLAEACLVMDALGENARSRLITWYCNTQLREYRQLFRGSEEAGSLDNISRRYSWFKRMLKTYDDEHAAMFPSSWRVNELLANAFCESTREDFKGILQRSIRRADGQTLDVDLLLSCLQETLDFEHGLERRFTNTSRASMDTLSSNDEKAPVFSQAISDAFEPYLSIWVEAQDKYLDQYAQQILLYYISERPSGQTPSKTPQIEDLVLVLNTADYCYNTSMQLEEKIKSRIDHDFKPNVDLQSQADAFMGIASATVRALVRRVEIDIEPTWREMRNTGWSKMESVGDQSSYVAEMLSKVKSKATEILGMLHKQQYARAFCDNVVELTASAYIANIFQCFEELLTLNAPPGTAPPPGYIKRVSQSMSRLDPILKTLQVRPSPPEAIVQAYLIHIADKSDANFRKILELKGIRKQDQQHLIDLFQAHRSSPRNAEVQQSSPLLTPLIVGGTSSGPGGVHIPTGLPSLSSAASLSTSNLPGRFDPSTFGNAIMTAARDGVDRFGTPALGGTPAESRVTSPPPQGRRAQSPDSATLQTAGHLNENLRNIGKFFKRDVGGFGRFGGAARGEDG